MNAACVKQSLITQIQDIAKHPELYCHDPGKDFTRKRKLPLPVLIPFILNLRGSSMTNEIINYFCCDGSSVSHSAIVQMRALEFLPLMELRSKHQQIQMIQTHTIRVLMDNNHII